MKLEHVKVGRDYVWATRVTVDQVSHHGTAHIRSEAGSGWKMPDVLQPLPAKVWLENMRANYAHRFAPDAQGTPDALVVDSDKVIYARWVDVPCGTLTIDREGTATHKRTDGTWRWWRPEENDGTYEPGCVWRFDDTVGVRPSDETPPWTLIAGVSDGVTGKQVAALVRGSK